MSQVIHATPETLGLVMRRVLGRFVAALEVAIQRALGRAYYLELPPRSAVLTGRYRASHELGIGARAAAGQPIKLSGYRVPGEAEANTKLRAVRPGSSTIYVTNDVPYAGRLERGWSPKAPQGTYGPALRALATRGPQILEDAIRRVAAEATR